MEKNLEILQFLDGALSHEAEAELLHRLSVSPERRDVLRSYIDQRVLFQRDREAINVPYAAEQKLWGRLGELIPIAPAASVSSGTTAVVTATRGLRWLSVASISTVCIVIGLLSGWYLGRNTVTEASSIPQTILAVEQPAPSTTPSLPQAIDRMETLIVTRSEAPRAIVPPTSDRVVEMPVIDAPSIASTQEVVSAKIAAVASRTEDRPSYVLASRERSHSSLAQIVDDAQQSEIGDYPLELSFAEGFGKQFPSDATSRNTQPIITNSSLSGMYQIYRGPVEVWVGASIGSANLARRTLREDPQPGGGSEVADDVSHLQTTWIGPVAQARHRFDEHISATMSAGASYSALGPLFYGEVGGRYDLTNQVGISFGLRSFHLSYDLTKEQDDLIRTAVYKIDAGGKNYGTEWSHNLEFLTGMYFRF